MSKVGRPPVTRARPAPRDGRRRSRRWRTPRCPRRGPRSSWPRRSSPPSRRRRAPRRGSAGPPCAPSPAGAVASASSAASSSPTRSRPSWIATVAGTRPASRTAASDARATSRFAGYGRPWLISVDSSATTGRPSASASATSGRDDEAVGQHRPSLASSVHPTDAVSVAAATAAPTRPLPCADGAPPVHPRGHPTAGRRGGT